MTMQGFLEKQWHRFLGGAIKPMETRCPNCYQKVSADVFYHRQGFDCHEVRTITTTASDGEEETGHEETRTINTHSVSGTPFSPEGRSVVLATVPIHSDYLKLSRKPANILSITTSGFSQVGKTSWLLSLNGLNMYPQGNTFLTQFFPEELEFRRISCDMRDLSGNEVLQTLEELWIDGDVPERTRVFDQLLRIPVIYELNGKKCAIVLNDFPGEATRLPQQLSEHENFPHLACSTDVVFVHPSRSIQNADKDLETFTNALGRQQFEGRSIDTQNINLIFALSKIDELVGSTQKEHQELLDICLQKPYSLPNNRKLTDMDQYLSTMKQVDADLRKWIKKTYPTVYAVIRRYNKSKVRFCAFSAFGFHPVHQSRASGSEAYLPFIPNPVRVADPLFWLLREKGLLKF